MENISGSVVLRPTRIGFLVRPTQTSFLATREIIRMCSCLWGGIFNPIIPVCTALPTAWRNEHFKEISGGGLADAYIRFFEPDVFVEVESGLAKEVGITQSTRFHSERVVTLKDFVRGEGRRPADFAFSLSVMDIYEDLYKKEFRFAPRKPRKVALTTDSDPFFEAVFGGFPTIKKLAYVRKAFEDVCEPQIIPATAETCIKLFKEGHFTPINATMRGLDVTYNNRDDPTIFVFDPNKAVDLIDFWNLRQFRRSVLPVSVHWFPKFVDIIRKAVTRNFRPLPGNKHGVMINTTIEFARSIDRATMESLAQAHLQNLPTGSLSLKGWYDPIWRTDWKNGGIQPRRANLIAEEVDIEESVDEKSPHLTFPSPAPKFASRYSFANNNARWMNVVKLSDYMRHSSKFAVTFPPNSKDSQFPILDYVSPNLTTREGIVLFRQYKSTRASLRLLTQKKAVIGWLESRGIKGTSSKSGRNADEVLRSLGGTAGCGLLADAETIKLLDKMAKTIHRENDGTTSQYADRTASIGQWRAVLTKRSKSVFSRVKLTDFTDHNVMRVGLSLRCPHCANENWYSLSDVDYEITCERCLSNFSFPQADLNFNDSDWRFRVLGPFSVPGYADGAYATVLTLRMFNSTLNPGDTPTTFSTGLDLNITQPACEIDFVGWYTEGKKFWIDPSPVVVFGEAKSFGTEVFKDKDVQRLKALAMKIPGSYVVFSALKDKLSDAEKRRIRKFAEWGRVPQKNREPRAMVIVLTAMELFSDHYLPQTWKAAGGAHANLVQHPSVHIDDLWTLADFTQQLYLDMPAYWEWRQKRRRKKHKAAASP